RHREPRVVYPSTTTNPRRQWVGPWRLRLARWETTAMEGAERYADVVGELFRPRTTHKVPTPNDTERTIAAGRTKFQSPERRTIDCATTPDCISRSMRFRSVRMSEALW